MNFLKVGFVGMNFLQVGFQTNTYSNGSVINIFQLYGLPLLELNRDWLRNRRLEKGPIELYHGSLGQVGFSRAKGVLMSYKFWITREWSTLS